MISQKKRLLRALRVRAQVKMPLKKEEEEKAEKIT
jgi:ABC-type methionine transport system ATPase subunit